MKQIDLEIVSVTSSSESLDEATRRIEENRQPFIIRGLDIGPCCSKWMDPEYLKKMVGDKRVVAHVAEDGRLDFLSKNFEYRSMPFGEFLDSCHQSSSYFYLRSTAEDARTRVANIAKDFPELASDFAIPELVPQDKLFSSVLRIGSKDVSVWTHYDVMDNVLIQVVGSKRDTLFPPSDLPFLYLKGDKSLVKDLQNPDMSKFPLVDRATRYEGILEAGDVVFIPALWFHTTSHLTFSVGFNVFWKHLLPGQYDPKDLYGNKDPLPARDALQGLSKAMQKLSVLPDDHRTFYALRMIERLKEFAE